MKFALSSFHVDTSSEKRDMNKTEKSQVSHDILAHLCEYPEASDTVEGIADWWLLEQKISNGITIIEDALHQLVTEGFVLKHEGRDSRRHYRINHGKYEEIKVLLKRRKDEVKNLT